MAASSALSLGQFSPVRRFVNAAHEVSFAGDLVQKFGDANARNHGIEPVGENFSFGGRRHFDWRDLQPVIDERTPSS